MKAITLSQPYATLVAIGAKHIETRSWSTRYRGLLAIHAAKGLGLVGGNRGLNELVAQEPFWSILGAAGCTFGRRAPTGLPLGAIVAVCELSYCIDQSAYWHEANTALRHRWPLTDQERSFGDYDPGRYVWLLSGIRALPEPIPAKGAAGIWEWDDARG